MRCYLKVCVLVGFLAALGTTNSASAALVGYRLDYLGDQLNDTNWSLFRLTNLSDNGAQITSFQFTIGAPDTYNWDSSETFAKSTLTETLETPDGVDDSVRSNFIRYTFTGFDPNEFITIRADVDRDAVPNEVLDFRSILFNNGAASNALVSILFSDGTGFQDVLADRDPVFGSDQFANLVTNRRSFNGTVPEPTLLAAWSLLTLGGICWGRRRH